jgi:ABC-type maltose transport systems, permease component
VKAERPATTPQTPGQAHQGPLLSQLASYLFLTLTVLLAAVPLWEISVRALHPSGPAGAAGLGNFSRLLASSDFLRWLGNSLFVALAVTVVGVILAATAGYALSRFHFLGRLAVLQSLLVTQIFPATLLLLPIFLILVQLKLINTFIGLILVYLVTVLPFGIWQMKTFYHTIPETIEEAAAMDGCTPAQTFRWVVLPISAQGLAVTALFSFAAAWNEYVVAVILMPDSSMFTLPVGLRLLHNGNMAGETGLFAAGALLVTLPVLVLYYFLSRFLAARVEDISLRA